MSLFLSQQKIPFQSVSRYLRAFAPSCEVAPAQWASEHGADLGPGDIVMVFDTILSPWGDSTSGIGVSEEDSFKVACSVLICDEGNQAKVLVVAPEGYRKLTLQEYLTGEAATAKENSTGFYYAIVRPQTAPNPSVVAQFAAQCSDGSGRADSGTDVVYSFFNAAGLMADQPSGVLDITALGYLLFLDKEPPAGSRVPDLRGKLHIVGTDEHRSTNAATASAETPAVAPAAAPPPLPSSGLPKMPSFFSKPKFSSAPLMEAQAEADAHAAAQAPIQSPPASVQAPAASVQATPPPIPATGSATTPGIVAPPVIRKPEPPKRVSTPKGTGNMPMPSGGAPPPLPGLLDGSSPWSSPDGKTAGDETSELSLGNESNSPEPASASAADGASSSESGFSVDFGSESDFESASPSNGGNAGSAATSPTNGDNSAADPWGLSPEDLFFSQPGGNVTDEASTKRIRPGRGALSGAVPPQGTGLGGDSGASQSSTFSAGGIGVPPALPQTSPPAPGPSSVEAPAEKIETPAAKIETPAAKDETPSAKAESSEGRKVAELESSPSTNRPMIGGGVMDWSLEGQDADAVAADDSSTSASAPASGPAAAAAKPESEADENATVFAPKPIHVFPISASLPPPPAHSSIVPTKPAEPDPALALPFVGSEAAVDATGGSASDAEASTPDADVPTAASGALQTGAQPQKKKGEQGSEAPRPQLKEPPAVKSGVAGLVSKLEQQASKASGKLESQVDEIQNRLGDELRRLLNKVEGAEKRSVKSAEGLRINLTHRMENATSDVKTKVANSALAGADTVRERNETGNAAFEEKQSQLRASLLESFDEVKARAEAVAKTFEESIVEKSVDSEAEIEALRDSIKSQLQELQKTYEQSFQASYDHLKGRFEGINSSVVTSLEGRYDYVQSELTDLHQRCLTQLEHSKTALLRRLSREITVAQSEISKLQSVSLEENVLPQLKQHREELRVITGEFQHKLGKDLEAKADFKVAEFEPILGDKKRKLVDMFDETNKVKDSIQDQLKTGLESTFSDLKEFVQRSIEQAQTVHRQTEDQLIEIDRAVRALADPSSIEGDSELLDERNDVLDKVDEITQSTKDEVLGTLRKLLAGLEEKSKYLQEEMITSMEEDAYIVRRASEQALVAIRDAVNETFVCIQSAQDERMPM